jgi:acetyl esterase/lipase
MPRWSLGFLMLSLLAACSPVAVLNALAPEAGITETRDVRYEAGDRHDLDIYAPSGVTMAPVVVFIYGGGWKDGDKSQYRFVAAALAARGFLTVVPDYRVFPEVRFPVFLQDNATAVAWTKANIARYGGDPHRIFLMGHSAGAYNVAMLTLDKQWLGAAGLDPDRDITGMIGLAGPYDFLPLHDPELEDIFGPAGDLRLSQPITFARENAPPMLLAAGTADETVLPLNTLHLAAAIRADGGNVQQRSYPGVNHMEIIGAMAGVLRWLAPSMADIMAFLDQFARSPNPAVMGEGPPAEARPVVSGPAVSRPAFSPPALQAMRAKIPMPKFPCQKSPCQKFP